MQVAKWPLLVEGRGTNRGFRAQTFGRLLLHVENSPECLTPDHFGESLSIFLHWARMFSQIFHGKRSKSSGSIPSDGVVASLPIIVEESGFPINWSLSKVEAISLPKFTKRKLSQTSFSFSQPSLRHNFSTNRKQNLSIIAWGNDLNFTTFWAKAYIFANKI